MGISKRGCWLGWSCMISFPCLCVDATAGDHPIEVHPCCCPGGFLGGLGARRGGLWLISQKVLAESLKQHPLIPGRHRLWLRLGRYLIILEPPTFVLD